MDYPQPAGIHVAGWVASRKRWHPGKRCRLNSYFFLYLIIMKLGVCWHNLSAKFDNQPDHIKHVRIMALNLTKKTFTLSNSNSVTILMGKVTFTIKRTIVFPQWLLCYGGIVSTVCAFNATTCRPSLEFYFWGQSDQGHCYFKKITAPWWSWRAHLSSR